MRGRRAFALAPFLLLLPLPFLTGACRGGDSTNGRPPVILISIDTLRADRLPVYGYTRVETPAIDALRRDGILAASAFSHYPLTLPAHVSILSGLLPPDHGVRDNVGYRFDAETHPYLPLLLKKAGYATGAAVSSWVLRGAAGLARGFDFYDDRLPRRPDQTLDTIERSGRQTVEAALAWLAEARDEPPFLFVHLFEPHFPHEAPEPFAARYADGYDAEVAAADDAVGTLVAGLKERGLYDRALIVLLSDHGEGLGDHGEYQHGIFLYRPTLEVPLLVKLPGGEHAGATIAAPTQLVDVLPTILEAAGIERPAGLAGTPLLGLLDAAEPAAEREIYSETWYPRLHFGWSELASLRRGALHAIDGPMPELFDLVGDPGESRDVLADHRRAFGEMRQAIARLKKPLPPPGSIDAEAAAKLAALGYLSAGSVLAGGDLPDPRDRRPVLRQLEDGFAAAAAGDHAKAAALYREALSGDPQMVDIWAFLGTSLAKTRQLAEAATAYRKALELSGGAPHLAISAAGVLLELGQLDEAARHAELAVKTDPLKAYEILGRVALSRGDVRKAREVLRKAEEAGPVSDDLRRAVGQALAEEGQGDEAAAVLSKAPGDASAATLNALAQALSSSGRNGEALAALERAVQKEPRNARTHELLGEVTLRLDRPGDARNHLERSLALEPRSASAWNTLGVALYQLQDPPRALEAWKRALTLDPFQFDALFNSGLVAASLGRRDEARTALRRYLDTAPAQRFPREREKAGALLKEMGG